MSGSIWSHPYTMQNLFNEPLAIKALEARTFQGAPALKVGLVDGVTAPALKVGLVDGVTAPALKVGLVDGVTAPDVAFGRLARALQVKKTGRLGR